MKVYNEEKTTILTEYDLNKGYIVEDKIIIKTIPPQEEVQEQFHYEYKEYSNGGRDRIKVIDVAYQPTKPESYEYEDIQVYVPYTEEELKEQRKVEIRERLEQLSQDFVQILVGAEFTDIEERKAEFISLHNELRALEGKEPREYSKV